jgi:uncharacterized protein YbjT (DUF2867 family)
MAMKKILITGSTGCIGRRLSARLIERVDLSVRLLVRTRAKVQPSLAGKVNVFEGDTFQTDTLQQALRSVDIAYYLIHSMATGDVFEERDWLSAENFRKACIATGVKRLIYLGGLGLKSSASKHLRSRIETGEILSAEPEKLQVIWIRAGIIIGSGSASFEIMRNLVQKLAIMVTPPWVSTFTQPIAIEDIISYLETAVDIKTNELMQVDIGADRLNFKRMMIEAAEVMGLKRYLFPVSVLTPRISSYWLILFTPVPYKVVAALIEGLKSETIIHFLPNGLLGRIYWYLFLPFHKLIFKSMGEQIIKLSVVDQLSS